jgi:CheY-like chemotaxis protein
MSPTALARPVVLLVDDNRPTRRALRRLLQLHGYGVLEAADARDAIDVVANQHVDAAIIDFFLPDLNGAELARELRKARPDLPLLSISGAPGDPRLTRPLFAAILSKPIDMADLKRALEDALSGGGGSAA